MVTLSNLVEAESVHTPELTVRACGSEKGLCIAQTVSELLSSECVTAFAMGCIGSHFFF